MHRYHVTGMMCLQKMVLPLLLLLDRRGKASQRTLQRDQTQQHGEQDGEQFFRKLAHVINYAEILSHFN